METALTIRQTKVENKRRNVESGLGWKYVRKREDEQEEGRRY